MSRAGLKILAGVFGIDATFHGHAAQLNVGLLERQRLTGGHANLRLDQIDAGDHFSHWMFDLNAGVDFDEVKIILLIDDELDGPSILIVGFGHQARGRFANRGARLLRQQRRRAFFDQLLVSTLHRAIAFVEVADIAMLVGDDLHFHMSRLVDELLQVDTAIAKGGLSFGLSLLEGGPHGLFVERHAHSFAATPSGGLDQHRITNFIAPRRWRALRRPADHRCQEPRGPWH